MSSSCGDAIRLTIFGESHGPAVGMTLEGLPPGFAVDFDALHRFLLRRAPGQHDWSTPRREADRPRFLSGLVEGRTCGTPLTAVIENQSARPADYRFRDTPRPGHADYTGRVKYRGFEAASGGGHFSGRLTAPLCVAGGIALQLLGRQGITLLSRIRRIADVEDTAPLLAPTADKPFPTVDDAAGARMRQRIAEAKAAGDSVGGVVECHLLGLPAGAGEPMFDGMENRIARMVFAIPAVKGIEFGAGFDAAAMRGSEHNDPFVAEGGHIRTATNHAGGILGGITTGMPLTFRCAFKPTPSIALEQDTVRLSTMEPARLKVTGRHDPCIVPRALPCVEAAAALAALDALAVAGLLRA